MNGRTILILAAASCLLAFAACSKDGGSDSEDGADPTVKVTYSPNKADSGAVPTGPKEYETGAKVKVAGNTGNLARTGYTYAGWNTKPDGLGHSYGEGDRFTVGSEDVTLYAKWDEIVPGFEYSTSGGKVTITEYTGSGGSVTIPSTINGLPVTAIGSSAFAASSALTSVVIPSSVTLIKDRAFRSTDLTSVVIPSSVTTIEDLAFYECIMLASVDIPASVSSIGVEAFAYCSTLASVHVRRYVPGGSPEITAIGSSSAFDSNAAGRKIYVPTAAVDAYKAATTWSYFETAVPGTIQGE
jgi:uncharacterized repeat protein (TIGR02543 family)